MNRLPLVCLLAATTLSGSAALSAPHAFDSFVEKVSRETGRSERDVREDAIESLRHDGHASDADLERIGRGDESALDEARQAELIDRLEASQSFHERTGLEAVRSGAISANASRAFDALKSAKAEPASDAQLVHAIRKQYENGDLTADMGDKVSPRALKGAAAREFKQMNKDWGPDYAPRAVKLDIEIPGVKGKTEVILIETDTDGGSYFSFFTPDGDLIVEGSQSESGEPSWSAAAGAKKAPHTASSPATGRHNDAATTTTVLKDIAKTAEVGNGDTKLSKYDPASFDEAKELRKLQSAKKSDEFKTCGPWKTITTRRGSINEIRKYGNDKVTADALSKLYQENKIAKILSLATNNNIECSRLWAKVFTTDGNVLELYYGMND